MMPVIAVPIDVFYHQMEYIICAVVKSPVLPQRIRLPQGEGVKEDPGPVVETGFGK